MRYLRLLLLVSLVAPVSLLAQGSKIGIVNFDRAVAESAEGQVVMAEFQAFLEERQGALAALQQELTDVQTRLETQQLALSPAALADLNRQVQDLTIRLTREQEDANRDAEVRQGELVLPIFEKANQVMLAYAAEQAFSLILDASNPQSGIIFASDVTDITTEIIRRMDTVQSGAASTEPQP